MAAFVVRTGVPRNYIAISCIVSEIKRVENRDFYTHLQLTPLLRDLLGISPKHLLRITIRMARQQKLETFRINVADRQTDRKTVSQPATARWHSSPWNRRHPPPPPVEKPKVEVKSMNHRPAADCAPCRRRRR